MISRIIRETIVWLFSRGPDDITKINRYVGKAVSWLSLALVLLTVYDVALRYFFKSGSIALQELEWHIFAVLFLITMGYTLADDEHVRVDIIYGRLSRRAQASINAMGCFVFLLPFSVLGIWSSEQFVIAAYDMLESSPDPGGLPYRYLIKAAIPLGFLFLGLQGLALGIKEAQIFLKESSEKK